jgi:hypothetical protein
MILKQKMEIGAIEKDIEVICVSPHGGAQAYAFLFDMTTRFVKEGYK